MQKNDSISTQKLDEVVITGQVNPQSVSKSVLEVKVISKEEAEKILKNSNKLNDDHDHNPPKQKKTESKKTPVKTQKAKPKGSTKKKVSKK